MAFRKQAACKMQDPPPFLLISNLCDLSANWKDSILGSLITLRSDEKPIKLVRQQRIGKLS